MDLITNGQVVMGSKGVYCKTILKKQQPTNHYSSRTEKKTTDALLTV